MYFSNTLYIGNSQFFLLDTTSSIVNNLNNSEQIYMLISNNSMILKQLTNVQQLISKAFLSYKPKRHFMYFVC